MPEEGVINHFFRYAENISDEDMQNLWARILAGEIAQPDSTSIMTMDVLSKLSKSDLQDLEKLFSCFVYGTLVIFSENKKDLGIPDGTLVRFEDIGILTPGTIRNALSHVSAAHVVPTYEFEFEGGMIIRFAPIYFGTDGTIYGFVGQNTKDLRWVRAFTTMVGSQLSRLTSIKPHPDLIKFGIQMMAENGYDQYFVINKKMLAGMSTDEIATFYRDQILEHDIDFSRYLTEDKTTDEPEKNT